jgi:hypothetical protein
VTPGRAEAVAVLPEAGTELSLLPFNEAAPIALSELPEAEAVSLPAYALESRGSDNERLSILDGESEKVGVPIESCSVPAVETPLPLPRKTGAE